MFDYQLLAEKGLNIYSVLNLKDLPDSLIENLKREIDNFEHYTQILLIGNTGTQLWKQVASIIEQSNEQNPIDNYSKKWTKKILSNCLQSSDFEFVFPSKNSIGLQQLGKIAGWHFDSPIKVGVNSTWGSWFAYRAVVLAKSNFPQQKLNSSSPCKTCIEKPCISACPVNAVFADQFILKDCLSFRVEKSSPCNNKCLSRLACPIAIDHQYPIEQIQYHYGHSFEMIKKFQKVLNE